MDLEQTRTENQERLTPHLSDIRSGKMLDALEPFAKAYLGLYYQLDNTVPPLGRVEQLSGGELYDAILEGFDNFLRGDSIPAAEEIGRIVVDGEQLEQGYILLAALEEFCQDDGARIEQLSESVMRAAVCYQLAHGTYQTNNWMEHLFTQRDELVVETLLAFWQPFYEEGRELLPGLASLLRGRRYPKITSAVSVSLLQRWSDCDPYTLRRLLQAALATGARGELYEIARQRIAELDSSDIKRRVYWLCTAYFIDPEQMGQELTNYMGRTKEKVLRLMDFSYELLQDDDIKQLIGAMDLAQLMRLIAPIIIRNEGRGGLLDEDSTKVLWMFEQFWDFPRQERIEAISWLQTVRVMKVYDDVLRDLQAR
ncbi:MAG: hypothetical protein HUJ29_04870 [Gammaproteobacteria bacterium]|nr:hypothetical protein [Gammaproteobacteria bacterium]